MKKMKHEELRNLLFHDKKIKEEYDRLAPIYEIKRQLIQIRNELGISQKELADKVGTRQSAISRLESGEYNPSIEFLYKVAQALGKELHITLR